MLSHYRPLDKPTALLLFSRSARAEEAEKRYGTERSGDLRIATALIARTRRTLALSGLPVFEVDELRQRGKDFGQRLAHAVSGVFALGYEHLIVVGNDCPNLKVGHLRQAAQALATGHPVVGGDQRGGAWLIGLQRSTFDAPAFARLAWQTGKLREGLLELLGPVTLLGRLQDINRLADLQSHWHLLRSRLATLSCLLTSVSIGWLCNPLEPGNAFLRRLGGRAPPLAA